MTPQVNEAWAAMKFLGEYVAKQESPTREADNSSFAIEQRDAPMLRGAADAAGHVAMPLFQRDILWDSFVVLDDSGSNESASTEGSFSDEEDD